MRAQPSVWLAMDSGKGNISFAESAAHDLAPVPNAWCRMGLSCLQGFPHHGTVLISLQAAFFPGSRTWVCSCVYPDCSLGSHTPVIMHGIPFSQTCFIFSRLWIDKWPYWQKPWICPKVVLSTHLHIPLAMPVFLLWSFFSSCGLPFHSESWNLLPS